MSGNTPLFFSAQGSVVNDSAERGRTRHKQKGFCEADVVREHYEDDARGREWQEAESGAD